MPLILFMFNVYDCNNIITLLHLTSLHRILYVVFQIILFKQTLTNIGQFK